MITQISSKKSLLLLSFLPIFSHISAQSLNVLPIMLKPNEITSLPYISVDDQEGMDKVKLAKQNYPAVIMQKQMFMDIYDISLKRTKLIADLEKSKVNLEQQDTVSQKQVQTYIELVASYKRQLGECDTLNARLNRSINSLSKNFDEAIVLVEKPIKLSIIKKTGIGLLGGAIGFSLATLLGAFK